MALSPAGLAALIAFWRERPGVSFSVGVPGVTAEFHAVPGEPVTWNASADTIEGGTSAGTIEIALEDGALAVPFDLESRRPGHRVRGCLFCRPEREARMGGYRVLRRVGPGLFDVGTGAVTVDALVVVDDPALAAALEDVDGERLVGTHHPALMRLVEASPPRSFRSALARITVTAPIATSRTPEGPHTHLLPDLIDGTTHDARIPVPAGWLPCLALHIPDSDPAFANLMKEHGP